MIVLDTHVWVWFVSNPELLSKRAKDSLDAAVEENAVLISSISAWEVALLVARKRLTLTMELSDWIAKSEMLPFVKFIPVDNSVAVKSVNLPQPLHNDPADRIIIATAISSGVPLVTIDEKILNYPHVQTIW
jgi:PIN domain nuclease of toxin-antitoxin system